MIRYISPKIKRNKTFVSFSEDLVLSFHVIDDTIRISHKIGFIHFNDDKRTRYISSMESRYGQEEAYHKIKVKNRDLFLKKWKSIRKKFRYEHEWIELRNDLKSALYANRKKEWDTVLPDKVVLWASYRLSQLEQEIGDPCVDNYRVAKVGNTCQSRRYRRQADRGCCGFFDCIELCPIDGKPYRLGFNYGH